MGKTLAGQPGSPGFGCFHSIYQHYCVRVEDGGRRIICQFVAQLAFKMLRGGIKEGSLCLKQSENKNRLQKAVL